jgi:cytochrome P450
VATPVAKQLFNPAFEANPHPVYAQLREESSVHRITMPNGSSAWLVTRYADVRQVLMDPRIVKGGATPDVGTYANGVVPEDVLVMTNTSMISADPPDHTRLRRLVSAAFTARRIERLRPRIQKITDELLDAMAGTEVLDLIDAFAFPLPIQVICELLGVPAADQASFRKWSNVIVSGTIAGDQLPVAFVELRDYMQELIARKRAEPTDDLLSALIAVDDGGQLSENELISTTILLLIAGHETTVNLIGNSVFLLLSERDRWERLQAEPTLLPSAIEEFLRFESPVETATLRITAEPVEVGGTLIPAGEVVLVGLQAGNRDAARFGQPDQLDMARPDNQHMAFGHGIHYCLGAPLARLEGQVALGSLLNRYPNMRLAVAPEELVWRSGVLIRGLTELPVRVGSTQL